MPALTQHLKWKNVRDKNTYKSTNIPLIWSVHFSAENLFLFSSKFLQKFIFYFSSFQLFRFCFLLSTTPSLFSQLHPINTYTYTHTHKLIHTFSFSSEIETAFFDKHRSGSKLSAIRNVVNSEIISKCLIHFQK